MNWDEDFDKKKLNLSEDELPQKVKPKIQKFNTNSIVDVAFNRKDPKQIYYRQNQLLYGKTQYLTKFGWKIADLQRQEEDLTLQCCNLLQSQFLYPIKFFINLIEPSQNQEQKPSQIKCLWMEATIHRSPDTNIFIPSNRSSQYTQIFEIYENKLLPRLLSFIKNNISWEQIIKNDKNQQEILNAFYDQVIRQMNDLIEIPNKNSDQ